jgi:hypothetical protein
MTKQIMRLWRGEEGLGSAFWEYTVLYGTLANIVATAGMFAALAAGLPGVLAVAIHVLPIPYNIFVVVAVWRSAQRYPGQHEWALLARFAVVIWALTASIA